VELFPGQRITASLSTDADFWHPLVLFGPETNQFSSEKDRTDNKFSLNPITYTVPPDGGGIYFLRSYIDSVNCQDTTYNYTIEYIIDFPKPDDNIPGISIPLSPVSGHLVSLADFDDVYRLNLHAGQILMAAVANIDAQPMFMNLFPPQAENIWTAESLARVSLDAQEAQRRITYIVPEGKAGSYYLDTGLRAGQGNYELNYTVFSVNNINRLGYGVNVASPGKIVYGDRNYTMRSVLPSDYTLIPFIMTHDKDRADFYWSFDVDTPVTMILVFNVFNTPGWLADWRELPRPAMPWINELNPDRRLFTKDFAAGTITLGPNREDWMPGGASMYTVFLQPRELKNAADELWAAYE
jgi:hypothetical protein